MCVSVSERHSAAEVITLKRLNTSAPTTQTTVFWSSHYAEHVRLSPGALVKGHRFLHPSFPSSVLCSLQLHKQREVTDSINAGIKYALTNPLTFGKPTFKPIKRCTQCLWRQNKLYALILTHHHSSIIHQSINFFLFNWAIIQHGAHQGSKRLLKIIFLPMLEM